MRINSFFRYVLICFSSLVSLFSSHAHANPGVIKEMTKNNKKLRPTETQKSTGAATMLSGEFADPPKKVHRQYAWKNGIVTTTFWIGEQPTENNPVPNHKSSWDTNWAANYGGTDTPNRKQRTSEYIPAAFIPRQNPFYIALPYNDKTSKGYKAEASGVIPWFNDVVDDSGRSTLKGRWIAIRKGSRVCYAQWEDCGPFRTDHWQYVFGDERPKPNLNKGAGLDVSPAVRDYLGMDDTDVTDWKFVEFHEVPQGPWANFGDNNTFVMNRRAAARQLAMVLGVPERPLMAVE